MNTKTLRNLSIAAGLAWMGLAAYGVWELAVDSDQWVMPYTLSMVALVLAIALTAVVVASTTRESDHGGLRTAGLALAGLGVAAAVVGAWALPLWMTILAAAFSLLAAASPVMQRRKVALLAASQFAGIAVLIACAAVGASDDLANGIPLLVTPTVATAAVVSLAGHSLVARRSGRSHVVPAG